MINFLEDHPPIEVEIEVSELPPLEYDDRGIAKPRGKAKMVRRMTERGLVGADVIASTDLQDEFNAYMAANGHPEIVLDCGDRIVHHFSKDAVRDKEVRASIKAAHDLFHDAYRAKGRMPSERMPPESSESDGMVQVATTGTISVQTGSGRDFRSMRLAGPDDAGRGRSAASRA